MVRCCGRPLETHAVVQETNDGSFTVPMADVEDGRQPKRKFDKEEDISFDLLHSLVESEYGWHGSPD